MNLHANARTCPNSRRLLVGRIESEGWSVTAAAEAAGVSDRTAYRWLRRFRLEGDAGLSDRSSAPRRVPSKTPPERVEAIAALRRLRMTAAEIAELLGMALSTVSRWLKRIGLGRRSRLVAPEPVNRYERRRPGELLHIDVKKLGRFSAAGKRISGERHRSRGAGWDFVHVAIDDHSRLAYAEVLVDEHPPTAVGFLERAVAWFAARGVKIERVITDNGNPYRSHSHALACQQLELKHLRTRPFRPQTNGKAERFIQTMLREWAYARIYKNSADRAGQLPAWLHHYNHTRPHGSLSHKPPATRLTNLTRNYT